jgi:hypothetical protein
MAPFLLWVRLAGKVTAPGRGWQATRGPKAHTAPEPLLPPSPRVQAGLPPSPALARGSRGSQGVCLANPRPLFPLL